MLEKLLAGVLSVGLSVSTAYAARPEIPCRFNETKKLAEIMKDIKTGYSRYESSLIDKVFKDSGLKTPNKYLLEKCDMDAFATLDNTTLVTRGALLKTKIVAHYYVRYVKGGFTLPEFKDILESEEKRCNEFLTLTEEENNIANEILTAIFAHEAGHIFYRDPQYESCGKIKIRDNVERRADRFMRGLINELAGQDDYNPRGAILLFFSTQYIEKDCIDSKKRLEYTIKYFKKKKLIGTEYDELMK